MKNLDKIIEKFSKLESKKNCCQSYEDALFDESKLHFGRAAEMFKRATSTNIAFIKKVFNHAIKYPEWYYNGGGMKKTYFLNASQIVEIATNWHNLVEMLVGILVETLIEKEEISKKVIEEEKKIVQMKKEFLTAHATKIIRFLGIPGKLFWETDREMEGKDGWFSCYGKNNETTYSYKLTYSYDNLDMKIYYSGWQFNSRERYNEFLRFYRYY
jgi:hypothetical protein